MNFRTRSSKAWGICWLIVIAGCFFSFQKADRIFLNYITSFNSSPRHLAELIPSDISAFISDQNFPEDWTQFRGSEFYSTFRNIAFIRDSLSIWNLDDKEPPAYEKWIKEFWGPNVIISYS